jgi:hypothetical protein
MMTRLHTWSRRSSCRPDPISFRTALRLLVFVGALAVFAVAAAPAPAEPAAGGMTEGWTQVVKGGFTDPNNSYAPTWAKFKDYLYISTTANEAGSVFSGSDKAGGDIWRTADGITWEQIGTAGLGNPHNNLFELIVFRDKLYAISNNINEHGIEIWVTSDGTQFTKIENGGFGDKNNDFAFPWVYRERLILGVSNNEKGGEIWVSDDGQSFRRVVEGGMGDAGVTGFTAFADPEHPDPIFQGKLYIGVSNPDSGGEIWRTADGLNWERVADKGLTRSNTILLHPDIVYKDRLYAFGTAGGTIDNLLGFDLFRTSDGTTWEQVVENGFNVGKERNVHGDLVEFKGRLYLTSNTMDPRLLNPQAPSERLAPRGFQLRVSDDGETWSQVGEDGFGLASSIMAGMDVIGDALYLTVFDYHAGSTLWKSPDGQDWETIFREPDPNFFQEGGGPLEFKGHFLWTSNDLKNGLEIWRTDEVMVAEETTTITTATKGETSSTIGGETVTSSVGGDGSGDGSGTGSSGDGTDGHESEGGGGLSGGWIALIAVFAVVAVAAIGITAFFLGRVGRGQRSGTGAATQADATAQTAAEEAQAAPSFCSGCGAALNSGARFCPNCGRQL